MQFKQYRRVEGVLDLPPQAVVQTVTAKVTGKTMRENLRRWRHMSPDQREQMRKRIRERRRR